MNQQTGNRVLLATISFVLGVSTYAMVLGWLSEPVRFSAGYDKAFREMQHRD